MPGTGSGMERGVTDRMLGCSQPCLRHNVWPRESNFTFQVSHCDYRYWWTVVLIELDFVIYFILLTGVYKREIMQLKAVLN